MGTNYYWIRETNICNHCGRRDEERLHIGKSSAGWYFHLHIIKEESINNLDDWTKKFYIPGSKIKDEYGFVTTPGELLTIISERKGIPFKSKEEEEEFHKYNGSEDGQNNLVRSTIDGVNCVGHGEGPWDYVTGEFS